MGVLGLSEYEFFTNSPYVNYCKWKGYNDRFESEASLQRTASWRIHQSLVQKPLTLREFWPLPSDKKNQRDIILPPSKEKIEEIRKIWKI